MTCFKDYAFSYWVSANSEVHAVRAINDRPYSVERTALVSVGAGALDGPFIQSKELHFFRREQAPALQVRIYCVRTHKGMLKNPTCENRGRSGF